MDKNLYHTNFPISLAMFSEIDQFDFKNKSGVFHTVCTASSLHETLLNNKFVALEQYRGSLKKGYSDMELGFFVNLGYYNEINDIAIKLINYWDKIFLWVVEGIDSNGYFLQVEPFPCLTNQDYLNKLILLWNQKHIYFHLYSGKEVVKTITVSNLFRRNPEIEKILQKVDINKIEETTLDHDAIQQLMKMSVETLGRETIQGIANQSGVYFELA